MKVSGSYASLLRGVSQQPSTSRQPGQHTEQVNMIPDPIEGLVRRQGSIAKRTALATAVDLGFGANTTALLSQSTTYRKIAHSSGGGDYLILVRTGTSAFTAAGTMPAVVCYNITANQFLPVNYVAGVGPDVETLIKAGGVGAIVSLGKYATFAVANVPCSTTTTNRVPNSKAVLWVRGGAYNRTYSVTIGATTYSYTTPDAAAPGAAAAIAPQNIAIQLSGVMTVGGVTGVLVAGAHVGFDCSADIAVTDNGDGTLLRGVYDTVNDASKLTLFAYAGMVVDVAVNGATKYYVKAVSKSSAVLGEVTWVECAGVQQAVTLRNLGVMTVRAGQLYVGMTSDSVPSGFSFLPNIVLDPPPVPLSSNAGDPVSNPAPRWMNSQITYMGLFQDRFIVAASAAVSVSAASDYYSFFRTTVLSVPASDAFEMVAQGSEDDAIRHSVTYNKNLVLFGDRREYIILGSTALTPTSANMSVMATYPDAASVPPVAAGGLIYYARDKDGSVGVHQIQPGSYVDSAESYPTSPQIGTYIPAAVAELEHVPGKPAMLLVRSKARQRSLYVFHYLDQPDGRKQEAWHRWDFGTALGSILCMHNTAAGLLILSFRPSVLQGYFVADLLQTSPGNGTMPHMDSMALLSAGQPDSLGSYNIAFDATTPRFLLGGALSTYTYWQAAYPAEYPSMWVGIPFESSVTLTPPYLRDNNGTAISTGRLVITNLMVSLSKSADMVAAITYNGVDTIDVDKARVVGDPLNLIGQVPVTTRTALTSVGRAVGEYTCTLKSQDWLPLGITSVQWTGQSFNRTPRA